MRRLSVGHQVKLPLDKKGYVTVTNVSNLSFLNYIDPFVYDQNLKYHFTEYFLLYARTEYYFGK